MFDNLDRKGNERTMTNPLFLNRNSSYTRILLKILFLSLLLTNLVFSQSKSIHIKNSSIFFSQPIVERVRQNVARNPWVAQIQKKSIQEAEPWMAFSDDELWSFMFGNTISRSWMVWSNGFCPGCKKSVPMYTWIIDPFAHPWKVKCPHCQELFPKNDFYAFYHIPILIEQKLSIDWYHLRAVHILQKTFYENILLGK